MEGIIIPRVTLEEIKELQEIGRATFSETFAHLNSQEDMQEYLKQSFSIEKLTDELTNQDSLIYFAVADEKIIGYLKINLRQAQTEKQNNDALEIERIYVLKEFHGLKVGQLLYQKALDLAYEIRAPYVWLGVWEENYRAIKFYEKNGFTVFGKHPFKLGQDEQTDLLMKKIVTVVSESKTAW
ncbi:GNAT family acetyltransferase [Pedobacter lusitanus]|uniref:GNAT family acetyltransferase n=1 Tax=Pedobacter lusitanus TaxID=1503925 RepID=A0A0D0GNT9_9SPHI|nr:GNAT family N-acetyltransferase [Pedobacter lusitanus]KIO78887.1 GNAT family acetyltransferase [Pedobacter lusitanus]